MIIFSTGLKLFTVEHNSLLHVLNNPEQWLRDDITEKAKLRREALFAEWRPRLFADASVTELPASDDEMCALIMARDDYKTRLQQDAAQDPVVPIDKHATAKFNGTSRSGLDLRRANRVPGDATVTLFASGIDLSDVDTKCMLAYVQDIEDWAIGALMGKVNSGKKKMIAKYEPIIRADPSVTTMPATEDGLITMILARSDYQRLGG
jgi:hypothetical protein|tara:strand:+ start:1183 stop:1803 length:621 start_codon:yes stop_codon:yes gene_type:complete